ncbi:hypothetical protein M569_04472 [Genlisea aurea]|uniref:Uncharacterized protein n=1 Tax=Genlisea aurea TaxID=192259 RepID=S8ECL0_9LAMI|nr:hypothetical protein M569_04472 [Genlisea aurea]
MIASCLLRAGARSPGIRARPKSLRFHSSGASPPAPAAAAVNDVTETNFSTALTELRRLVRDADFVSIDLEMTGVTSAPWREALEFDRSDIQYLKIKDSAERFSVVQFGVCPFRWDTHSHCFVAHPYNFYLFPRQEVSIDGFWNDFLCQTSSLEFLAKHQFDFNTCIYKGISYLSRSQELEALNKFPDSSPTPSGTTTMDTMQSTRMSDILFVERMKNTIDEWLVELRVVVKHFRDLCYVHGGNAETSSVPHPLIVYTDSVTDRDLLMREVKALQREKHELKVKAAIGFRHVIDLLSSEKKLIVGHNCFLDWAHVYRKFFGPLPPTVEEFASELQAYFPHIIDTKVMLNSDDALLHTVGRAGTSLSKAFSRLCSPASGRINGLLVKVEVQVDDRRVSNWNSGSKHEAGYDAFMTGSVFSQACLHLGIDLGMDSVDLRRNEKLGKYLNLLYLSWANGDVVDLKTGRATAAKSRYPKDRDFSKMVVLWGEPSRLKTKDIRECFSKTFGTSAVTSARHLDETAALVQFSGEELVEKFLEWKDALRRDGGGPISSLHPLTRIFDGGTVRAGTYETYKEICSSPVSEFLFSDQAEAAGR